MMDIDFGEVAEWYDKMLQEKYEERLSVLKKYICSFYNLADQISILYYTILKESEKFQFDDELPESMKAQQKNAINTIINKSLLILTKMTETKNNKIDKTTCDKFSSNFELNLNVLCTYYHSLNHCEIVKDRLGFEKKKIVEGINKLFAFHSKIKDLYKNKHFNELKAISHQKRVINSSKKVIIEKVQVLNTKVHQVDSIEKVMADLYQELMESTEKSEEQSPPLRFHFFILGKIMMTYLQILQKFYEAQAQLEFHLTPLINYCQELKQKKKRSTSIVSDAFNVFTRISSQLIKPNYLIKTFKKLKIEEFSKSVSILLQELLAFDQSMNFDVTSKSEEIIELTTFMVECIRQLDKVESSGVVTPIQEYKEKLYPYDFKKKISRIIEFQRYMAQYYQVQELIKKFEYTVKQMALKQFEVKVNIIFDDNLLEQPKDSSPSKKQ